MKTELAGRASRARNCPWAWWLTVVFTAANVYFGLKAGSLSPPPPGGVLSMALLRWRATTTAQEKNIVQRLASPRRHALLIIFVLPGSSMIGVVDRLSLLQSVDHLRRGRHPRSHRIPSHCAARW